MSIERLLLAIEAENNEWADKSTLDVYVIGLGEAAKKKRSNLRINLDSKKFQQRWII